MEAMTSVREPLDYVKIPLFRVAGVCSKLALGENRYQIKARGGVFTDDLLETAITIQSRDGAVVVQLLPPTNATAKGQAVEFETEKNLSDGFQKGNQVEIYTSDVRPIYQYTDWTAQNQLRYSEAQTAILQAGYSYNPMNRIREILEIVEAAASYWKGLRDGTGVRPTINSDGTILTPEQIVEIAEKWELAEIGLESTRQFVIEEQLARPIDYERFTHLVRAGRVIGICAALDISTNVVFDRMSAQQIETIWSRIEGI